MGEQGLIASLGGTIPVIGLGIQALGMGASIIQGINANKDKRDAERAAEAALNEAKKKLSVNRLEGVQVPLSAYNEAFKTGVAQQQQALAALSESDPRALAAGVGKIQSASVEQDERTRQAMEQAVYNRDVMVANAQQKIDQNLAGISLEEAKGAQQAAMQAEQQAAAAFSGAVSAAGNIGQNIYESSALYGNNETETPQSITPSIAYTPKYNNNLPQVPAVNSFNFSSPLYDNSGVGQLNRAISQANNFLKNLQPLQPGLLKFE